MNISFETDSNGDISPNLFFPIYWSQNLFSGIGYTSSKNIENSTIQNFSDSRESKAINQQNLKVNFLSKKFKKEKYSFSIGLIGEYINIENTQFGFIHDKNSLFQKGDIWIAFDNSLDIEVLKYGLYFDVTSKLHKKIFLRLSGDITPTAKVKLAQNTRFKPLVLEGKKFENSSTQDFSYSLLLEMMFQTDLGFSLGAEYEYIFFPLKYNLAVLGKNGGNYFFQTSKIESETVTDSWIIKLILDKKILGDMQPSIGFGKSRIVENSKTTNNDIIRFGIEKRF